MQRSVSSSIRKQSHVTHRLPESSFIALKVATSRGFRHKADDIRATLLGPECQFNTYLAGG